MIQTQIKLRLNAKQETLFNEWLWILTGVHNWAVRKIELDAKDGIYYSSLSFSNLLARHGQKVGIPRISVFQRTPRDGFTCWGNQMPQEVAG